MPGNMRIHPKPSSYLNDLSGGSVPTGEVINLFHRSMALDPLPTHRSTDQPNDWVR